MVLSRPEVETEIPKTLLINHVSPSKGLEIFISILYIIADDLPQRSVAPL